MRSHRRYLKHDLFRPLAHIQHFFDIVLFRDAIVNYRIRIVSLDLSTWKHSPDRPTGPSTLRARTSIDYQSDLSLLRRHVRFGYVRLFTALEKPSRIEPVQSRGSIWLRCFLHPQLACWQSGSCCQIQSCRLRKRLDSASVHGPEVLDTGSSPGLA